MKALLDAMQFKQIMDGCKHAVSTDNSRPILGYIKLDIKGGNNHGVCLRRIQACKGCCYEYRTRSEQ